MFIKNIYILKLSTNNNFYNNIINNIKNVFNKKYKI